MAQPIVNPTFSVNKPFDYEAEKDAVLRRQKYAEMLGQSALQPIEAGSYNGIQSTISPVQGLAKILEGAGAGYLENQAAEGKRELETNARTEVGNWLASINEPQQLVEGAGPGDPGGGEEPYEDRGKSEERLRMAKIVRGLTSGNPYTTNIATMMYGENLKSKQGALAHERAKELAAMKAKHGGENGRPSSPIQNFEHRTKLAATFGEGSPEVARFDNYVRQTQIFSAGDHIGAYNPVNPSTPTYVAPMGVPPAQGPANAAAVETGKGMAKAEVDAKVAQVKNTKAFNAFSIGINGIEKTFAELGTDPVTGRFPALTSAAQKADGAIALIGPALKSLFRESGEGVWTDRDQADLMAMVPTRKDHPETVKFKLDQIRATVAAKLGVDAPSGQDVKTPAGRNPPPPGAVTKVGG